MGDGGEFRKNIARKAWKAEGNKSVTYAKRADGLKVAVPLGLSVREGQRLGSRALEEVPALADIVTLCSFKRMRERVI